MAPKRDVPIAGGPGPSAPYRTADAQLDEVFSGSLTATAASWESWPIEPAQLEIDQAPGYIYNEIQSPSNGRFGEWIAWENIQALHPLDIAVEVFEEDVNAMMNHYGPPLPTADPAGPPAVTVSTVGEEQVYQGLDSVEQPDATHHQLSSQDQIAYNSLSGNLNLDLEALQGQNWLVPSPALSALWDTSSSWVNAGSSDDQSSSWEHIQPGVDPGALEPRHSPRLTGQGQISEFRFESAETRRDGNGRGGSATSDSGLSRTGTPATRSEACATTNSAPRRRSKQLRVRGKLSKEQREKAKMLRKIGSCLRCRVFKLSCDGKKPCSQCEIVLNSARSFFEPCYRDRLDRVTLARHGNNAFQQRDVAFLEYLWRDKLSPSRRLYLRWNLPGNRAVDLPHLKITCKEFIPTMDGAHCLTWNIGENAVVVTLPPFAADDICSVKAEVQSFLENSRVAVLNYILEDLTDDIASSTLKEAVRFAHQHNSSIIDLALRIRCASFCSQGWASIIGNDLLGIETINFNTHGKSSYAGFDRGVDTPIPNTIDHQLDVALLLTIKEYQRNLLDQLAKVIFSKAKRKPWYEIFLTIFVLLSNLEYVHGGALSYYLSQTKTKNATACYSLTQEMIDEFNYSAENLLYHFCSVLRGNMGFKLARENFHEMKDREGLDEPAIEYMRKILDLLPQARPPRVPRPSKQEGNSVSAKEKDTARNDPPAPDGRWIMRLFDRAGR